MKNKEFILSLLVAGMSMATAWAIRGQFGHAQGAAWAGGIGGLGIVLAAKRPDWYQKAFQLALAAAAGWGITGIISYGLVVGYGRGTDFGNVYYGLLMLFVIGSLFGLIGGGLFGLMLADRPEKPVNWPRLITEMTAGAIIFYALLVGELGWLMTPPRSEAWAACVGMVIAMYWYMIREKQFAALRVSVFAALGGGFGFAFGNFLQVMGHVSEIKFNFWNVMEYSIGFFGGVGMAYGTFTSTWEPTGERIKKNKLISPIIVLSLLLPFIVWDQSFETERLVKTIEEISPASDALAVAHNVQWVALILAALFFIFSLYRFYIRNKTAETQLTFDDVKLFFFANLGLYTVYSLLITCAFMSLYRIEQYLYLLNGIVIFLLIGKCKPAFANRGLNVSRWAINLLFLLAIIALLTAVAVSSHGELKGAHSRFE
jgi:hypothetical protein